MAGSGAEKVIVAGGVKGVIGRRSGQDVERGVSVAGVVVLLRHVPDVVRARAEIEHCPGRKNLKDDEHQRVKLIYHGQSK